MWDIVWRCPMTSKILNHSYEVILDRKEAILSALNNSLSDEVIVILGKGNEKEQIINGIKHPFNDKKVIYDWVNSLKK